MSCFSARQIGDHAVEEERGLVQQPLGRLDVLEDDALGHRLELRLLVGGELLAGEDDHGHVGERGLGMQFLEQLEAGHVRQAQVEHHAVEGPVEQRLQRLAPPVAAATISMSSWPSSSTMDCRSMSLSSTISSRFVRGAVKSLIRSNAVSKPSVVGALTR